MSNRAQRLAALALLVIFLPSVAVATAYALRPVRTPLTVYALDSRHRVLPAGSVLRQGQHITVVAIGFRPRTAVQVVDTARRFVAFVRADRHGIARKDVVVPHRGTDHLGFALDGPIGGHPPVAPRAGASGHAARIGARTVTVAVPLLRRYTYSIAGGGVRAAGVGVDPGTHTTEGRGGLANTGIDVLALTAAALLLLVLGAVVLLGASVRGRAVDADEGSAGV